MARDQEKDDSVYDFLYVDSKRIASFLSQFDQFGHLTSLTRTVSETSTSGGGVNLHVVKLEGGENATTTQIRQFDPQWIAPLSFLDQAGKRGMIQRGLDGARIGQLVLVSGALRIVDAAFMKDAWSLPAIGKIIRAGMALQKGPKGQPGPFDLIIEILRLLPHPVQAQLDGPGFSLWGGLAPENLLTAGSDLMLKHGAQIAGEWYVLGILDAEPDDLTAVTVSVPNAVADSPPERIVATAVEAIAPIARTILGRQPGAYGVTPILIFREVSA